MRGRNPKDGIDVADCAEAVSHPAAQYKKDQSITFTDIPDEILVVIGEKLSPSTLFNLSLAYKKPNQLFFKTAKPALTTQFIQYMLASKRAEVEEKPEAKAEADANMEALLKQHPFLLPSQFLQYIVMDEQEKAEDLLKQHTSLLYAKGTAIDFVGRQYQDYTAMQLAYATNNIALNPGEGHRNMADMLKNYFVQENKAELIAEQIDEKFPEGREHKPAFNFETIFNAINQAQTSEADVQAALDLIAHDTPLWRALETFRQQFGDLSLTELRFNPTHLLAAFRLNEDQYYNFRGENRRKLYACQVIGCAERYLPAGDLKVFAQGLYSILYENKPRQAGFSFADGVGNLLVGLLSGDLGTKYWGRALLRGAQSCARADGRSPSFSFDWSSMCEQKRRVWQTLCSSDLHCDRKGASQV